MTDEEYWSLDPAAHQFIHRMQAQRAREERDRTQTQQVPRAREERARTQTQQVPRTTVNTQRLLSMWWLLAWRGTLGGFVLGAVAGFVSQILFGTGAIGGAVAGLLAGLAWNLVVIQMLLEKKFRGFHLAVVEE
jgi:predicted lipid-binding transport protein (Tim44 family)